nr:AAA family ATPase [Nitrosomonas nitrosa]
MKLDRFRVTQYRNIVDSGTVRVTDMTAIVGPNESGKSNLFEALYRINPSVPQDAYNIDEDWPVDNWGEKGNGANAVVCVADFLIDDPEEVERLFAAAAKPPAAPDVAEGEEVPPPPPARPKSLILRAERRYAGKTSYRAQGEGTEPLESAKVQAWAEQNVPKFVLIQDYALSGNFVELPELAARLAQHGWNNLSNEDQTILIILELANIDIKDFVSKGDSAAGRTQRTYDKRQASYYLSEQFSKLWRQKRVEFDIEIDGPTMNIMAKDEGMRMPVRLHRRSTGFRWHVSFAWKFTRASKGEYKDCIILLEEPGVHLHPDGQRDLVTVFERLAKTNTVMYTTHLASMLDPAFPERIRICEVKDHHATVIDGVVSSQRAPMAVIEARLGISGDLGGLLGNRQTLVVEGGDDLLILSKLSGLLMKAGRTHMSNRVYMWPAEGASKTPMYAGFLIGQKWEGAVLLDSDAAGDAAAKKIKDLYLKDIAAESGHMFRILSIGKAAGLKKNEAAIEDLFPDSFYIDCVNNAYHVAIKSADLPADGSSMITKRVESVLNRPGFAGGSLS